MSSAPKRKRWTTINIVALVLGFIVWWPIGLAILAYILWGREIEHTVHEEVRDLKERFGPSVPETGASTFESYKSATLRKLEEQKRRLEAEQEDFSEFMDRLRCSRDREEFDRFMNDRRSV